MNGHVALLGDSILDNGAYTEGRSDVRLPSNARVVVSMAKLRVIELRLVCTEPADYANTIEPSIQGGEKIARAIVRSFGLAKPSADPSRVFY